MGLSPAATGGLLSALTGPMFLLPSSAPSPPRSYLHACSSGAGSGLWASPIFCLRLPRAFSARPWQHGGVGALLISGSGCAVLNVQIAAAAVSAVPPPEAAMASAICVTIRQIGFAFGIAPIGALLRNDNRHATAFAAVACVRSALRG